MTISHSAMRHLKLLLLPDQRSKNQRYVTCIDIKPRTHSGTECLSHNINKDGRRASTSAHFTKMKLIYLVISSSCGDIIQSSSDQAVEPQCEVTADTAASTTTRRDHQP